MSPCSRPRYSAEPIEDDDALVEKLVYVLTNATAHDLVERVEDWPGLTSARSTLFGEKMEFEVFYRTEYREAGCPQDASPFKEKIEIEFTPPPCWEDDPPKVRRENLLRMVRAREADFRRERKRKKKKVLGKAGILAQQHYHRPRNVKKGIRPLCHASTKKIRDDFKEYWQEFCAAFWEASQRFRAGDYDVEFPPGSFPPRLARVA